MESSRTKRCLSVLSVHLLLSIVCLSVGFFSPFYFGLYDQCDFIEPERTFTGWSIHRDLSDLYGAVILLGFLFLGVSLGIIGTALYAYLLYSFVRNETRKDIRHAYGYERHSVLLLSMFGSFGVFLLLKILLLDELPDSGWNSPCWQTRFEFWMLFGTLGGAVAIAMVVPFCKKGEKSRSDLNRDPNATREELEQLLEAEEARKLGDGRAMSRLLAESIPDLHWVCLAFI